MDRAGAGMDARRVREPYHGRGSKDNRNVILIAAAYPRAWIILGGYLLGDGLRRARMADRAVTVRGLAERNVTADLATWTLSFTAQGAELGAVQAEIDHRRAHRRRFLPRRRLPGRGGHRRAAAR